MSNLSFVHGHLSSPPQIRLLESGSRLVTLQVTVRAEGRRAVSLPVAVWEPPDHVERLGAGDAVFVLGRVERRFYASAGGGRGSRVELVAEAVVPASDRRRRRAFARRVTSAFDAIAALLATAEPAGPGGTACRR